MNDVRRKIAGSFDDVQQAKDALKAAFASEVKVLSQYPGEMNKLRESAVSFFVLVIVQVLI